MMTKETTKKISKAEQKIIKLDLTNAHDNYSGALTKHAFYKTGDHELSKDLVQITFLKTLQYLQKGGKIDTMRSFLNHVLNNLVTDEYRKRKATSLDSLIERGFEPAVDDFNKVLDIFEGKQALHLIKFLPKKYQTIMRMRYVNNLSLKEMALLTDQSENTVAVQAHRGLAKLRVLYEESQTN